jgi:hypothetical protein
MPHLPPCRDKAIALLLLLQLFDQFPAVVPAARAMVAYYIERCIRDAQSVPALRQVGDVNTIIGQVRGAGR